MGYASILNKMTWSFSRLHAYESCPYSFYMRYIEEREPESNFYAENGHCMHETFEAVLSNKIPIEQCIEFYTEKYEEICAQEKQSIMDKTFEKCVDYLSVMSDIDREKYEIIGVEMKLNFRILKYNFIGFADLVVKNKDTGRIILVDHKQATHFLKKDGTPLKNQLENFLAYKHQMYLYCIGLKLQFGIDVDEIVWHHFKDDGKLTIIPFNQKECDESKEWAVNLIKKIKKDKKFESLKSYIMCSSLCNYRHDCEYNSYDE